MIFVHKKSKRYITATLITLIVAIQVMVPLFHVRALVFVSELPLATPVVANTTTNTAHTIENYAVNYVLKPLLRVAVATLVQSLINQTVAWITGDEGKNVGFVKNLENEMKNQLDARAGEVLNRIAGINLCSASLKHFVRLNLTGVSGDYNHLNAQLSCSLTGIVDNVDRFYGDFSQGGWPAFVGIATDPRNNAFGATLIAAQNLEAAKGSVAESIKQKMEASGGFLGVQLTRKSPVCETIGLDSNEEPIVRCYNVDETVTPGKLVSESLSQSLNGTGFEFLAADSDNIVNNAVNAIMGAVVQRLMKEATNLF